MPLHMFRNMLAGGDGSVDGRAGRGRGKGKKRTLKSKCFYPNTNYPEVTH